MHHSRVGPIKAPLLHKFQNDADSAAESEMCLVVCAFSEYEKGAAGIQMCMVFHSGPLKCISSISKISVKIVVVMGTHCLVSYFT
jgi:hypothetical protein